jgi:hypothetical protein
MVHGTAFRAQRLAECARRTGLPPGESSTQEVYETLDGAIRETLEEIASPEFGARVAAAGWRLRKMNLITENM